MNIILKNFREELNKIASPRFYERQSRLIEESPKPPVLRDKQYSSALPRGRFQRNFDGGTSFIGRLPAQTNLILGNYPVGTPEFDYYRPLLGQIAKSQARVKQLQDSADFRMHPPDVEITGGQRAYYAPSFSTENPTGSGSNVRVGRQLPPVVLGHEFGHATDPRLLDAYRSTEPSIFGRNASLIEKKYPTMESEYYATDVAIRDEILDGKAPKYDLDKPPEQQHPFWKTLKNRNQDELRNILNEIELKDPKKARNIATILSATTTYQDSYEPNIASLRHHYTRDVDEIGTGRTQRALIGNKHWSDTGPSILQGSDEKREIVKKRRNLRRKLHRQRRPMKERTPEFKDVGTSAKAKQLLKKVEERTRDYKRTIRSNQDLFDEVIRASKSQIPRSLIELKNTEGLRDVKLGNIELTENLKGKNLEEIFDYLQNPTEGDKIFKGDNRSKKIVDSIEDIYDTLSVFISDEKRRRNFKLGMRRLRRIAEGDYRSVDKILGNRGRGFIGNYIKEALESIHEIKAGPRDLEYALEDQKSSLVRQYKDMADQASLIAREFPQYSENISSALNKINIQDTDNPLLRKRLKNLAVLVDNILIKNENLQGELRRRMEGGVARAKRLREFSGRRLMRDQARTNPFYGFRARISDRDQRILDQTPGETVYQKIKNTPKGALRDRLMAQHRANFERRRVEKQYIQSAADNYRREYGPALGDFYEKHLNQYLDEARNYRTKDTIGRSDAFSRALARVIR